MYLGKVSPTKRSATDRKLPESIPEKKKKKRIAIKLQSELFMVLSLLFFIVILVKKKKKRRRRQLHYQNHAVLETCQYVYELRIH